MRRTVSALVSILLLACFGFSAEAAEPSPPTSWGLEEPLETIATLELSGLDVERLLDEDELASIAGGPLRFATSRSTQLSPRDHGTWESLPGGLQLWRLRIRAPGATSLGLAFERFALPPGARLDLYSSDRSQRIRAFDHRDNTELGELWTPALPTDDLIIELTLPAHSSEDWQLTLGAVHQGYRDLHTVTASESGACNVDVECPQADAWRDEVRSVARYLRSGIFLCTGYLLNNTAQDRRPFFMTSETCGVRSDTDQTLVVYWNYLNSFCRPPGSGDSGDPGDGVFDQFTLGSTFLAGGVPASYTLVELWEPPWRFDVFFAGWDARPGDFASAVTIHHPRGEEKRISFEDDPTETTSYLGLDSPGDGSHIRIVDWDLGTTEAGSTGSPLFGPDHHVIGTLHGGFAACGNDQSDWFGRFSVAWDGVSPWLDPRDTGGLVLDGVNNDWIFVDGFESGDTTSWSAVE